MSDHVFIIGNETQIPIGICGLHRMDWVSRNATFGILIGEKDYWGLGHGTETLMLILSYAFLRLNLHKIELEVFDFNKRAQKCYIRCGFIQEGRKRVHSFKNGEYHDSLSMGILKEEWTPLWEVYLQKQRSAETNTD